MYPELKFFRYICSNLKNSLLYLQFVLSLKHTNLKTTTIIMRELFRNIREAIYYAYYRCREYEDSFDDFPFRGPRRWDSLLGIHFVITASLIEDMAEFSIRKGNCKGFYLH